jgi:molybdopterin-guanine dinucleotide biosynthesis adapter protein
VASTRIISIIGRKGAGKTTLTVALAGELARRRRRVMTIKHGHHPADVDRPGTDSWRHFEEGRAERVLLVTPGVRVLFDRAPDEYDPAALARRYLGEADIVLAEGFKRAPIPKIEVFRSSVAPAPIYDAGSPDAASWAAIVTDDLAFEASPKVIHFQDTMWLQLLATLALEHALALDP